MIRNYLFHRVNPVRDPLWDPMDVNLFDKCIEKISKKYKVDLFENLASNPDKLKTRNKYATIMFDDGYKDNLEFAIPILEKYNVKASFYVVTDCIYKNIPTWTYIIDYSIQNTNKKQIEISFPSLPEELRYSKLDTYNERIKFAKALKPFLKKLSFQDREIILENIYHQLSDIEIPKLMMNWDDLRLIKNKGHYIGSHTVTHTMLGTMTDEDAIFHELKHSANVIQKELGHYPVTISYPIGSYNETTKKLSKKAGYKIGLAVKQNIYNPDKEDIFEVSRMELYNEPWWKTKMRMYNYIQQIKNLIK